MDLRRLDDRVVGRAAASARRVRATAAALPGPTALLRTLDERYASTGVLRVVRDAPVIGVLAAATVLLAGTGTSAALTLGAPAQQGTTVPAQAELLGVPAGGDAEAHLVAAQERAVRLARETPGTRYLALVSLRDELTVAQAVRLLVESQLELRRAYVRAPVAGGAQQFAVDLPQDPERTLTAFWSATAQRKAEEQRELTALAADAAAPPEVRAAHEAAARTAGAEAAAYASGCACVLALVVEGPAGELAELTNLPVVRGVEVAPRGVRLETAEVVPLPPEVSGSVSRAGAR